MADTLITQEILDMATGNPEGQGIRDYALGKTRSQFAAGILARLEVAVAEAQAIGDGIVSYSIKGETVTRSMSDALQAIEYFKKLSTSGASGGIIRMKGSFYNDW